MNFDDIESLRQNTSIELKTRLASDGIQVSFIYDQAGSRLSIDGNVCIPVEASQYSFEDFSEIEIYDLSGTKMGSLVLTAGYELDLRSISDHFYMAYLTEISSPMYGEPYHMRYSYVILEAARYQEYLDNYFRSASLWGGFVHLTSPSSLIKPYKGTSRSVVAVDRLSLPTPYHTEHAFRSVIQPFAFERFQKLYHLLELQFDREVVERIKALGSDLKGIGQIFSEYGYDEIRRLRAVIEPRIHDVSALEGMLNNVKHCANCEAIAKNIFFSYGKERNPLKEKEHGYDLTMATGGFSKNAAKTNGLVSGSGNVLDRNYDKLIVELVVYWIYRIRSSIVHSRIGEYVMTSSDEEFVVEVGEPLLRQVILQVFRS